MKKYYFVIAEQKQEGIEYLGLYDDEHRARKAFLEFSSGHSKEYCDKIYRIIVFINDIDNSQIIFEEKPSRMKWYQVGDKENQ